MLVQVIGDDLVNSLIRLFLSLLCGGALGFERGRKKRPAGFRTYMLVCLGSALVMMTNEYIARIYNTADPARMAAQVISGIGFLGAGTIIVTMRNRVIGLTTAAGLWAAACIGLAIGIGYYSVAIMSCVMILIVMSALHSIDERVMSATKVLNLYIEFERLSSIGRFIAFAKERNMRVSDLEITKSSAGDEVDVSVLLVLRLPKAQAHSEIMNVLVGSEGVKFVEEV